MCGTPPRKINIVLQNAVHIFLYGETSNITLQYQLLLSDLRGQLASFRILLQNLFCPKHKL
jgi:hypothetical protein